MMLDRPDPFFMWHLQAPEKGLAVPDYPANFQTSRCSLAN